MPPHPPRPGDRASDVTSRIGALSPAKRELLARRLKREGTDGADVIAPRTGDGATPVSPAQERLWLLDQLHPGSAAYNICEAYQLDGAIDIEALRRAFDALVARHESLRTTFASAEGGGVQMIAPPGPVDLVVVDLSDRPEADRDENARRLVEEEARCPMDLTRGPLLRVRLIRLAADRHVLVVTIHHIVSDAWTMAVLFLDLSRFYATFAVGQEPALSPLPIQYADFALWQRQQLAGEHAAEQLAYWREQLRDSEAALTLPYGRPAPDVRTSRGAEHRAVWPKDLSQSLDAVAVRAGATPFMTLFAAFAILLHRYTGQEDLLIGSAVGARPHLETEGLIGFFVNTLVLRTKVDGEATFLDLLAQVRETALAAYEHQDVPFDRVIADLRPDRSRSRTPLAQVMFGFLKGRDVYLELPGVTIARLPVHTGTAKSDLSAELLETPSGLTVRMEYSTDVFDADTIERMSAHYRVLLEAIAAKPDRLVRELPLLTPDQRQRIVVEWNRTEREYLEAPCIGRRFEQWAARTPEALAAVAGEEELTYGELNTRANRLARHLRKRGVGPDVLVGVCLERSAATAVAMLGILKAGGAYVPLDPNYPPARLADMLSETRAPVIVTQRSLRDALPECDAHVVCLDDDAAGIEAEDTADLPEAPGPDETAYVIYTSGSMGRPKGVVVPHHAVLRLVVNADYVALGPSDVVAQASTTSFDAATFEIWGPLLNGGRFAVIARDVLLSPRNLTAEIQRQGVTVLFVTTALFNQIADEDPRAFEGLSCLLFGGEASDPSTVAAVLGTAPPERLIHVYGPTEATTFATWHLVRDLVDGATTVPIGRPIANTTALILDRYLNPSPVGITGELHIGGPGLARGYLDRPDLTAERFIRDPLSDDETARLYKTGDLARYLPDGSIELLGRLDEQVKIRGFRIEPGEIESVLRTQPGVRDAVVLARQCGSGGRRLVAYVVADQPSGTCEKDLRAALGKCLPVYMIPSAFVTLDRLPLTANGKVDRRALPEPDGAAGEDRPVGAAPSNPLERELADIWQDVLEIPRVGVDEDFFDDLGGHSLLAVRLFARIARELGRELPIAALFEAPTIQKLAALLRNEGWREMELPAVALGGEGAGRPFFCVSPMDAFGLLPLARRLASDRPLYCLHPLGSVDREAPQIDVPVLAADYIRQVRSIQAEGPYLVGGHSIGGVIAFEMARQLQQQGQTVALLALFDTWFPWHGWAARINHLLRWRLFRHARTLRRLRPAQRLRHILSTFHVPGVRKLDPGLLGKRTGPRTDSDLPWWGPFEAAYYGAMARYTPEAYIGRPMLFLCARESRELVDRRRMWRKAASGGVEVHHVPGNHRGMMQAPHVQAVADVLRRRLAEIEASLP